LGLARRSGALVLGFDNVLRELEGLKPPKVLIEAFDGASDGKRKLYAAAHRLGLDCVVIESLTSAELGLALGRENVIHAAVRPGGFAERLILDAERLSGFRPRTESQRAQARSEKE
jgi:ribosomal protein L30E